MKRRKGYVLIIVFLFLVCIVTGCAQKNNKQELLSTTAISDEIATSTAEKIFRGFKEKKPRIKIQEKEYAQEEKKCIFNGKDYDVYILIKKDIGIMTYIVRNDGKIISCPEFVFVKSSGSTIKLQHQTLDLRGRVNISDENPEMEIDP